MRREKRKGEKERKEGGEGGREEPFVKMLEREGFHFLPFFSRLMGLRRGGGGGGEGEKGKKGEEGGKKGGRREGRREGGGGRGGGGEEEGRVLPFVLLWRFFCLVKEAKMSLMVLSESSISVEIIKFLNYIS